MARAAARAAALIRVRTDLAEGLGSIAPKLLTYLIGPFEADPFLCELCSAAAELARDQVWHAPIRWVRRAASHLPQPPQ
jgi:hypothetical protein